MRSSRRLVLFATVLLMVGATAQARVSHGYSEIITIDTVTAVNDDAGGPPSTTSLVAVYPNPFNPRTTIAFDLAEAASAELAIFDLRGRLVRRLESGVRPSGHHRSIWDGLDDSGRAVPTGTYFCRLTTQRGSQTMKLTVAR